SIKASQHSVSSPPIDSPKACLRVMSRADCKALAEAELTATEDSGPSFRPEECLRYYTRAECMALLDSQMPK
ncbi:MAG TPA: hypothetical protein VFJ64_01575, partial [Solirubrobacterales bacterium]|nr:hypothetical protein [Solirubrobacterales bacterium]